MSCSLVLKRSERAIFQPPIFHRSFFKAGDDLDRSFQARSLLATGHATYELEGQRSDEKHIAKTRLRSFTYMELTLEIGGDSLLVPESNQVRSPGMEMSFNSHLAKEAC